MENAETVRLDQSFCFSGGYVQGHVTYRLMSSKDHMEYADVTRTVRRARAKIDDTIEERKEKILFEKDDLMAERSSLLDGRVAAGKMKKSERDEKIKQYKKWLEQKFSDELLDLQLEKSDALEKFYQFGKEFIEEVDLKYYKFVEGYAIEDLPALTKKKNLPKKKDRKGKKTKEAPKKEVPFDLLGHYEGLVKKNSIKPAQHVTSLEDLDYCRFYSLVYADVAGDLKQGFSKKK